MLRIYLVCVFVLASQLCTAAPSGAQETGFLNRTLILDGQQYRFVVYVPREWPGEQTRKWPTILFLHGYGEGGDDGLAPTEIGIGSALRYHPERYPFLVVFPQFQWQHIWLEEATAKKALAALDAELQEFHGDPDRVYLTGLSVGGYGVWYLASHYANRFAAVAPVAGGMQASWLPPQNATPDIYRQTAERIGKTPVWIFHGADDGVVPVSEARAMFEALQRAGGNVRYYEYQGIQHNSWDKSYGDPEFPRWLLQYRLSEKSRITAHVEKRFIPLTPKLAQVDPKIYDDYAGRYECQAMPGGIFRIAISHDDSTLTGQGDGERKFTLLPLSDGKFWNAEEGEFTFYRDQHGTVTGLSVLDAGQRHTETYTKRKPAN